MTIRTWQDRTIKESELKLNRYNWLIQKDRRKTAKVQGRIRSGKDISDMASSETTTHGQGYEGQDWTKKDKDKNLHDKSKGKDRNRTGQGHC